MVCSVTGCGNAAKYVSSGWCQTHYHRYWRTGSLDLQPKALRTDLTYFGAHGRVKSTFGSATKYTCVQCGLEADEWAYDGSDESERQGSANGHPVTYSVWPEFYMPMCFACHRARDAGLRFDKKTVFGCGHPRSEDNTYTPPSRPRSPECRSCRSTKSKTRYEARRRR